MRVLGCVADVEVEIVSRQRIGVGVIVNQHRIFIPSIHGQDSVGGVFDATVAGNEKEGEKETEE